MGDGTRADFYLNLQHVYIISFQLLKEMTCLVRQNIQHIYCNYCALKTQNSLGNGAIHIRTSQVKLIEKE